MADKSNQLILTALSRAAAAAAGVPLHGTKAVLGLFPTNAAGKQAAQRCQEEGYLCLATTEDVLTENAAGGTATLVKKKASGHPLCTITDKGLTYLLGQVSPRQVLEDFVRAVEAREQQADDLLALARQTQQSIESLKANVEKVLHRICPPDAATERGVGNLKSLFAGFLQDPPAPAAVDASDSVSSLHGVLLAELTRWHNAGASEDCPLPHLYRQLPARTPASSIGQFHDALRQLHDLGKIYLHPWTGPLYDIPEPPYALLIGHEIAYYASIRS